MSFIRICLPVAGQPDRPSHGRQKAVLTCPRCRHASPPDGDWIRTECDRGTEINCPDCEQLLTVRERFDDSDTSK